MRRTLPALLLLALAASACAKERPIGSRELLAFTPVPATTPTPTPAPTPLPQNQQARVTPPPKPTPPPPEEKTFQLFVDANGFDPPSSRAAPIRTTLGTKITVVNRDPASPHQFLSRQGGWDSGPIAPGKSWTFTADKVGLFEFIDGLAPYRLGALEVSPG